jgi:hypothetical protein
MFMTVDQASGRWQVIQIAKKKGKRVRSVIHGHCIDRDHALALGQASAAKAGVRFWMPPVQLELLGEIS